MNNENHETVEDAARRDRLERAMTSRAGRWCAEQVAACAIDDEHAERLHVPANVARQLASAWAEQVVRAVYVHGRDAADELLVDDAWRHRALVAWADLLIPYEAARVREVHEPAIVELEAADAAVTWQLPSERIAR